jgi:hypothetical protein
MKEIVLALNRSRKKTVSVPRRITTHKEFVESIRKIRFAMGAEGAGHSRAFVGAVYYLLGWMVGDGVKNPGSRRYLTMHFRLQLTRKHPENLQLGQYVMGCLGMLGVKGARGRDGRPRMKVPNGSYSWNSSFSSIVGWLFTACLGLKMNQLTTVHSVRMEWLLYAPKQWRIWFLRGLADSDGDVDFHHRWVRIATSPNTTFIKKLFESLGLHTRVFVSRNGYGYVGIPYRDAFAIQIFNPLLATHRRIMLEKLAAAKVFRGRWPDWLDAKVDDLARNGLSDREISEAILDEYNVYARIRTIKKKRSS